MASLFVLPRQDVGSGIKPSSGAKLFFFVTGTSTPKDTFTDAAGTIPHANPVIADSNGVFPVIFIVGTYKVQLKDKNNVQSWEVDPVDEFVISSGSVKRFEFMSNLLSDVSSLDAAELDYFDSNKIAGSGEKWIKDGTSGTPGTTDFANKKVFNGNGDGYLYPLDVCFPVKFGMQFDGSTVEGVLYQTLLSAFTFIENPENKTTVTASVLVPAANTIWEFNGSTIFADPTLPNTGNIVTISELDVTMRNGKINGNRANLIDAFPAGSTGNGIMVVNGGDGARILNMETFECPTNGQVVVSVAGGTVDNVIFDGYNSHDNTFGGVGGEAQVTGLPLTNLFFLNGKTSANQLGGDLRIQGVKDYIVFNHTGKNGLHGGVVLGNGEANNVCRGKFIDCEIGNDVPGLATVNVEGLIGGGGPQAGLSNVLEVDFQNVTLVGVGGTGLRTATGAIVTGNNVTSIGHFNNAVCLSGSLVSIDNFTSRDSLNHGMSIQTLCEFHNLVVEGWGVTETAISFGFESDNSIIKSARLGYSVNETGAHDGANNAAILTDTSAPFIPSRYIGHIVRNLTDGSRGTITANTSTTITGGLGGGTDNDWDIGDVYEITKEDGLHGISVATSPSGITLEIDAFNGFGNSLGGVSSLVLNTWKLQDLGAHNTVDLIDGISEPAAEVGRSKMYFNVSDGTPRIIDGSGLIYQLGGPAITTTAALLDIASAINTDGRKQKSFLVHNDTTNALLQANNPAAGEPWLDTSGAIIYTPV